MSRLLFFLGESHWGARARIFTDAAHGLAARGHEVSVACPPGPVVDRIDTKSVGVVRIDPAANTALGTFDFRRIAQERSLDVVFVHTSREQLIVGSGLRFARGGSVFRRVGFFEPADDAPGLLTAHVAPARLVVSSNAEAAGIINRGEQPPFVVPFGIDCGAVDAVTPVDRRTLHLRDDAMIVACPYAPNGRVRALGMMRALALLAPRHPRLRAVLYGERAMDDDLRMQAAALGVAPLLQFVDAARIDSIALMKASDFAWVVADHDAGALGCLDAMSAGRPVVAERSPAIDHFVADGINGATLPAGDAATVTAAVASVIARTDARAALGSAGRLRVQREFTSTAMIDGFERAVQAALPVEAAR